MNNFLKVLGLSCIFAFVAVCSHASTSMPYKITGELITIEPEAKEGETAQSEDDAEAEIEVTPTEDPALEPVDLSEATLTVSYETTNAEGESETVMLYDGPYQENFANVVQVSEPTDVKISLHLTEDSEPMTINAVIGTDSDVRFAYIDRPGPRDQFVLVGATNQVMNPENQFTLSGDLSFLGSDISSVATVSVDVMYFDDEGQRQFKSWGPVLLKNDSFMIQGDVDGPMMARMWINDSANYYANAEIILEPQTNLVVSQLGNQIQELSVTSGSGYHRKLVESWQQDSKYISMIEAYATEYDQFVERWEAGEPEPEVVDEEDSDVAESETDSEDSSESEDVVETLTPAEGCEDVVAQDSDIPDSSYTPPQYYRLQEKAVAFKNDKLKEVAEGDDDPMSRYLALEFSPYGYYDPKSELDALQSLVDEFDEQFVESNLNPKIERLNQYVTVLNNDAVLIPGQKVPEFTLADYDGEDRSLYSLLGDKDIVLIDFWASWCGPCIADFPELKKLHAAYTDEDFEIVGVSIDSTDEDWLGGVDEHELPWINLGEVKGWEGPVSTMYGVNAIPKGFLVDSQGCIYKKNIRPAALKEFLVDRYGMDESLEEPEVETEDTQEVSS
ncbi:MAG: redoxin domain-containing protein [Gammaproteobacteria bacterium]|nr:redoxin domain-containing protein [Gammaproteobacteria bacterium]MYF01671.1 redoxin domain-containing protein [Gammaproteobacteria bacterium]MYI78109.1 redoxin domain-containing protein [Gammaproteobacteria bacterium]